VSERSTSVGFRYGFRTRWPWLRPILDRVIAAILARDITARVKALKHAAEETTILERIP
jgi:hypothetical protein